MLLEYFKHQKIYEINKNCNQKIYSGTTMKLNEKELYFTYDKDDQTNIFEMFVSVQLGATEYSYHYSNGDCQMFAAEDIIKIYSTMVAHKTHHLTYYNQLKRYVNNLNTIEEVKNVKYGQELTGEYLETYNEIMEKNKISMETVLTNLQNRLNL